MDKRCDLQTVLNSGFADYRQTHTVTPLQAKVCVHIEACRTEAMGGCNLRCDQCGYQTPRYHSCRDRHCPKCQSRANQDWCDKQLQAVLPVTYYHVVFTLPHQLNAWVQLHPDVIYQRLFQAVWSTLKTFAADPKRLDGQLGMTAALHTWGQNLSQHVHLHCLVPGGAWGHDGRWHPAKSNYLFPVRALSRYFRGKMVALLRESHDQGALARITRPGEVDAHLNALMKTDWVVYSKHCLTHTPTLVGYLARYSHRTAIGDQRISGFNAGQVQFRYHDYRTGKNGVMSLDTDEFIRRFLLHVLPQGFMRIRHYGFLANCCRKTKLTQIRAAIAEQQSQALESEQTLQTPSGSISHPYCPKCRQGRLFPIDFIAPKRLKEG